MDKVSPPEKYQTREIIRRALLVAFGVLLLIPASCAAYLVTAGNPDGVRFVWEMLGGVVVAFFLGRLVINWVFLK
jgi:hypothetical protein